MFDSLRNFDPNSVFPATWARRRSAEHDAGRIDEHRSKTDAKTDAKAKPDDKAKSDATTKPDAGKRKNSFSEYLPSPFGRGAGVRQ